MKVLHIITGLGIGGAEQQLRLLLRKLPTDSAVVTPPTRAPSPGASPTTASPSRTSA